MFGLTFEKLFLVAIIAGFVLGPQRLPAYAHKLGRAVRTVRHFVDTTRSRAEDEMGMPLRRSEWESMDLRQYDPRRIVSDALRDTDTGHVTPPEAVPSSEVLAEAARVRPGQKYLITGGASHPRRILVESLPDEDSRRLAAALVRPAENAGPADSPTTRSRDTSTSSTNCS